MRTRTRHRARRRARALLGVALALGVVQASAAATSGEASFDVEVPAGAWKGVRLRNIPRDATLAASVESDGAIAVALLDAEQYAAFPSGPTAVFRGRSDGRLSFAVRAPARGDYYLIVDNREGSEARAAKIVIRAEIAGAARGGSLRTAPGT